MLIYLLDDLSKYIRPSHRVPNGPGSPLTARQHLPALPQAKHQL